MERPIVIVNAGIHGSGKTTLARNLSQDPTYRSIARHVSMGDEVRRIASGAEPYPNDAYVTQSIRLHMASTERYSLLSDDIAHTVAANALSRLRSHDPDAQLFFLNGFPRRSSQVDDLQTLCAAGGLRLGGVLHTTIDPETALRRILKRRPEKGYEHTVFDRSMSEIDAFELIAQDQRTIPPMLETFEHEHVPVAHIETSGDQSVALRQALGQVSLMLLRATWHDEPA